MIQTHDHPAPGEPGLRKDTYEELVVRVADAQRAAEHHLRVRNAVVEMMRTPSPHMLALGKIIADLDGSPGEIWEAMSNAGMMELFEAGKL